MATRRNRRPKTSIHRGLTKGGAESREALLTAAIDLISERGFAATGVDAICEQAGLAKTALYWHFGSKEDLLTAVLERAADTWIDEIRTHAYVGGGPEERLDRFTESLQEVVEKRPQMIRLLLQVLLERADIAPEVRLTIKFVFQRTEQAISQGIRDAVGGPLPDLDLVAHTAFALFIQAMLKSLVEPGTDLDRLFADFRRTFGMLVRSRIRERDAEREAVAPPAAPPPPVEA